MTRLILFLIRLKLGVKKYEKFRFSNQKNKANYYYIDDKNMYKVTVLKYSDKVRPSHVPLSYLLSSECKIEKETVL